MEPSAASGNGDAVGKGRSGRAPVSGTRSPASAARRANERLTCHYSMQINWSDEDEIFVVTLPEFGPYAKTHGATYEEAAQMGREVLELLVALYDDEGRHLPAPELYRDDEE